MADDQQPITMFICGRGMKNPGLKYKCKKCEKYFNGSLAYTNHECKPVEQKAMEASPLLKKFGAYHNE
jgi:hypothetical protein